MAQSPSHKFGQIIGDLLEESIEPLLRKFAKKYNLYLDIRGDRPARRGKKVCWIDIFENKHDLDFVYELNGTDDEIGIPVAFIESAWRRYTKHSRNKAQEIQGAILPLFTTHQMHCPFIGVVIAGVFTEGAISQLKSRGFTVLYFPYETIIKAFSKVKIDASFDEDTPDALFEKRIKAYEKLNDKEKGKIKKALIQINKKDVDYFMSKLEKSIERQVKKILILPLHGKEESVKSINDALKHITDYKDTKSKKPVIRFEIIIIFNNDDRIEASFKSKEDAIDFLKKFQNTFFKPA